MEDRLNSWKAIAGYLGREVRTVQRWAKDRGLPVHRLPGGSRPRVFALKPEIDAWLQGDGRRPRPPAPTVAVLPFVDLGSEPAAPYFGAGLAEDVIDELVRVPGLRVIARTSSAALAAAGCALDEIGARLGAPWLVEGSVRRAGRRVRVAAQLVSARTGVHAWSGRYDRELTDIFAIQDDIARSIAHALEVTLTHGGAPPARTEPGAYDLWTKGRVLSQQFTPEAIAASRACFEEAIARDPLFARPHFGLAALLFQAAHFGVADLDVMPRAQEAIVRALELDPHFGEAHAVQGILRGLLDRDWSGAETSFRRALELSPGSAAVLSAHAWYHLVPRMRLEEAVAEAMEAVALDPISPLARAHLGLVLVTARDYDRACEACRTAVELAPGFWWVRWFYGTALLARGDVAEGLQECRQVYERLRTPLTVGAMAATVGVYSGPAAARTLFRELETLSASVEVSPQAWALACLGVGDDRVFQWLDRAITARDPMVTHLPSMPLWDRLRADPRFPPLLARIGLG